jgi:16S rRNA C967 or C1407 C5-methylase (RsmB/RsmF family)
VILLDLFLQFTINYYLFSAYYCLDGASILPVIALEVKKDDFVLDLCSSPGGKTITIMQTMLPSNYHFFKY